MLRHGVPVTATQSTDDVRVAPNPSHPHERRGRVPPREPSCVPSCLGNEIDANPFSFHAPLFQPFAGCACTFSSAFDSFRVFGLHILFHYHGGCRGHSCTNLLGRLLGLGKPECTLTKNGGAGRELSAGLHPGDAFGPVLLELAVAYLEVLHLVGVVKQEVIARASFKKLLLYG